MVKFLFLCLAGAVGGYFYGLHERASFSGGEFKSSSSARVAIRERQPSRKHELPFEDYGARLSPLALLVSSPFLEKTSQVRSIEQLNGFLRETAHLPSSTQLDLINHLFSSWASESYSTALDAADNLEEDLFRNVAFSSLMEEAYGDRQRVVTLFQKLKTDEHRSKLWSKAISLLPADNPMSHLKEARDFAQMIAGVWGKAEDERLLTEFVAKEWSKKDPLAAWDYGLDQNTGLGFHLRSEAITILAKWKPEEAMTLLPQIDGLKEIGEQDYYKGKIFEHLFQSEPEKALGILNNRESLSPILKQRLQETLRNAGTKKLLSLATLSPDHPILQNPPFRDAIARAHLLEAPDKISDYLRSLEASDPDFEFGKSLSSLADYLPVDSYTALLASPENKEHLSPELEKRLLRQMAAQYPDDAVKLVENLPIGSRSNSLHVLSRQLAKSDPVKAARLADSLNLNSSEKKHMMRNIGIMWANSDPQEALNWISQESSSETRAEVLAAMTNATSSHHQELAELLASEIANQPNLLTQGPIPNSSLQDAIQNSGKKFADQDPQEAMNWLDQLPAGLAQEKASQGAFNSWAKNDSVEFANWLIENPDHPTYDQGAIELASSMEDDLSGAFEWASTIKNPEERQKSLSEIYEKATKVYGENINEQLDLSGLTNEDFSFLQQ